VSANPLWGPDWPAVRRLWRLDDAIVHLNHGSFGAAPAMVLAEQDRWRALAEANPTGFFSRMLRPELAAVRERVADFVGADAGGLALVPNASSGIAAVLGSVELQPGDEVLVTDHCYRGVRAAAEQTCRRARARLRTAELSLAALAEPGSVADIIMACVTRRTRLLIIDHITSPTGAIIDVASIATAFRDRGIAVAVDGAHAPGSVLLDVDAIDADFYTANLHKWCCAPAGAGFIVVAPRRRHSFRSAIIGSHWDEGFPAGAEWWGTSDYSAMLSSPAALALLEHLGLDRVRHHNLSLAALGQQLVCAAIGTTPPPCLHASMSLVPLPEGVASTDAEALRLRRSLASEHGIEAMVLTHGGNGYVRLSAHAYNSPADYERLAAGLPSLIDAATSTPQDRG
jgi:isopenicillin-N epimerase